MLRAISVCAFALIDELEVEFAPGLNVLTGETGAGKSLLIDALLWVLGGRPRGEVLRPGTSAACVEALFELSDRPDVAARLAASGLAPDEGLLVLRREVGADGRSTCRANGHLVTVGMLRRAAECLVDVHGQGEQQRLLQPAVQRDLLDLFAGAGPVLREVRGAAAELRAVEGEHRALQGDGRERERRRDLLAYQLQDIEAVDPRPHEDEDLAARRAVVLHAERLFAGSSAAYAALREGDAALGDRLAAVQAEVEGLVRLDPRLEAAAAILREAVYEVEEAAHLLRRYRDGLACEPEELDRIEGRLEQLARLKRKYGPTLADVLAHRERIATELASWEETEALLQRLQQRQAEAVARLEAVCARLTAVRGAAAQRLQSLVDEELAALGMPGARLEIAVEPDPAGASPTGADRIEFLFAAHEGEPTRPLARVASGGELARVMLALKAIAALRAFELPPAAGEPGGDSAWEGVPTLVFDEVDAGIGGRAAVAVAERLQDIARHHQVLCVTHLAVIAAAADVHLSVEKAEKDGRPVSRARRLTDAERRDELARMLSGAAGVAERRHAQAILERARRRAAAGA